MMGIRMQVCLLIIVAIWTIVDVQADQAVQIKRPSQLGDAWIPIPKNNGAPSRHLRSPDQQLETGVIPADMAGDVASFEVDPNTGSMDAVKLEPSNPVEVMYLSFTPASLSIPENTVQAFTIHLTCTTCRNLDIFVAAAVVDTNLAIITPAIINMTYIRNDKYEAVFNITTFFLGRTAIFLSFGYYDTKGNAVEDYHKTTRDLSVERIRDIIDELFDIMMQVFLVVSTATFGCELDLTLMKGYFKKPIGACIGLFCQYGIMPSIALLFDYVFDLPMFIDYGLLAYASCPGGGASNIYTSLLGGEINLSITMTFISTVASMAFMPMWMYTAGTSLTGSDAQIPFTNILTGLAMIVIPVFAGILFRRFFPKFAITFVKVLRPISIVGVLFLTGAGFYINFYIIEIMIDMGWQVGVPSVFLPYIGILLAMGVAALFRQPWSRVKTVGIETGVQNMPLAVLLLRSSLQSPASQLAAVGPVVAGLATPIPIVLAILFRMIYLRCKGVTLEKDEDKDDISIDGDTDDKDYQLRRASLLDSEKLERIKAAQENELAEDGFVYERRERAGTTDTMLSDFPLRGGRDRSGTTDTMLSDFPPSGRTRAATTETMLSDGQVMGYADDDDTETTIYSKKCANAVVSNGALPGTYRYRSDTNDTMTSEDPMLARRGRSGTIESFLQDSPAVARKGMVEMQQQSAAVSPKLVREPQPDSFSKEQRDTWKLFGRKFFSRQQAESPTVSIGTPGLFRKSSDMDQVMIDMSTIGAQQKRSEAQEKVVQDSPMLFSDLMHTDAEKERSKVNEPSTAHPVPPRNKRDSNGETSVTGPAGQRDSQLSSASTQISIVSADTGIGSECSSLSHRRRSLSLSSIETISAYVEYVGGRDRSDSKVSVQDEVCLDRKLSTRSSKRSERSVSVSDLETDETNKSKTAKKRADVLDYAQIAEQHGKDSDKNSQRDITSNSDNPKSKINPIHKLLRKSRKSRTNESVNSLADSANSLKEIPVENNPQKGHF